MTKIAVKRDNYINLYDVEKCSYIKAGWRKPSNSYQLGDWGMKHPIKNPAKFYKPMVSVPGLNTWASNARMVNDDISKQIDDIDNQIKELKIKRQQIINDEFLTFQLIEETDLQPSYENKDRYETKAQAEAGK